MCGYFLSDGVIGLAQLSSEHLSAEYVQWLNDMDTCSGNSHFRFPYTMEKAREYLDGVMNDNGVLVFAVHDASNHSHIGNASLQEIDWINRSAEFAILLGAQDYRGRGVGYNVARLLFAHGFNELNLHRIYLGTYANNIAMQKMAEKVGMKKVGVLRDAAYKGGNYIDVLMYDMLENEFAE